MNRWQTFQQFLATQSAQVDIWSFSFNLAIAAILAFILGVVFIEYATTISNRRYFAKNFVMISLTTTLIITIVKTSLALSLGLVGALSIVRFRAAIKEPEELSYLFLTIGIGLGMGAGQRLTTIIAFVFITLFIILRSKTKTKTIDRNLFLTISGGETDNIDIEHIFEILNKYCASIDLQRLDETSQGTELSFLVEFSDHKALINCKTTLQDSYKSINISFLDYKGLYAS